MTQGQEGSWHLMCRQCTATSAHVAVLQQGRHHNVGVEDEALELLGAFQAVALAARASYEAQEDLPAGTRGATLQGRIMPGQTLRR